MTSSPYDAVVVGGGPAGSAAAIELAQEARSVLLLEKDRFPRPKVCGEFLSSDALPALERLGVRRDVEKQGPERIERGSFYPPRGPAMNFRLPAPALGISRLLFDDLLARRAGAAGSDVRFGTRVLSVEREDGSWRVRFSGSTGEEEVASRFVVGAWGRWDALDRRLERGFERAGAKYFGWSRDYGGPTERFAGQVRLYLFPGGYCGLSRVEGGVVNLAGVLSEETRRRIPGGWDTVLDHVRRSNDALDADLAPLTPGPVGFLGTGPVFFAAKPPTEEGILMAGDAAGVIDPFSGQGQAAALASGILAGETIAMAFSAGLSAPAAARVYSRAWKRVFSRRFRWSRVFRRLVLNPRLAQFASRAPGADLLVRFALRSLRR